MFLRMSHMCNYHLLRLNLVCHFTLCRPDLIEYEQLKSTQPLGNLNNAFDVAERELGIARLLDAEGIKMYITYKIPPFL